MAYGVTLKVWGDYACFTRPEMKVERVSYDVMTPSAARGVLEAVYWKPAIRWVVESITVLRPIRFENVRRNELGHKLPLTNVTKAMKDGRSPVETFIEDDRQQRAAMVLRQVAYLIQARFEPTAKWNAAQESEGKHLDIFNRRLERGACFPRPYLGCREFAADFGPDDGERPDEALIEKLPGELGWMLHDLDYAQGMQARFFKAQLKNGVMTIPPFEEARA